MKLIDLNEARYAGEHPVIAAVAKTLGTRSRQTTFWDIEEKDIPRILKSLTARYGEPVHSQGGHAHHWETQQRYGKNMIAIGWDPDVDPPYGVEVY